MTNSQAVIRESLEKKLATLEGRIQRLQADLAIPLSADFADQATQTEDDEAQEAEEAVLVRQIGSVKAALSRLDSDEYGICMQCGNPIQAKRLKAIPESAFCIDCASDAEMQQLRLH